MAATCGSDEDGFRDRSHITAALRLHQPELQGKYRLTLVNLKLVDIHLQPLPVNICKQIKYIEILNVTLATAGIAVTRQVIKADE